MEVLRDEHLSWLLKTLERISRKLFFAEDNGIPVGRTQADIDSVAFLNYLGR